MNNFPKHWLVAFAGASLSLGISSHFQFGNVEANGILTFLGVFLVYNRYLYVEKSRPFYMKALFIVLHIITLCIVIHLAANAVAILLLILSGSIGITYSFKINPSSLSIRDIPFIKIGIVVTVWTLVCCIFPWVNSPIPTTFNPIFILHFFYIFAIALAFDIRDVHIDQQQRRTIPQIIGIPASKTIVITSQLFFIFCFNLYQITPAHKDLFFVAVFAPIVTLFIQKDISPKVYGILLEMSLLILGISYFSL